MPSTLPTPRGIVLFAHGSRDPLWRLPIEAVAAQIRARQPGVLVRCAYLEICTPSLPEAAADLMAAGAGELRVFPLFLGVGKHAREDLPLLIEDIRSAHPGIAIELLPAAGEYMQMTTLLADIAVA
ncbi:CbiX/SirB N-terminal domain-containing protein [Polaromonas sp.]|uniref:sirohydrochlorin chelatase n=1 Tax=Polaromonas sp. TaxID=1869339 RepID=UPI0013B6B2F9|nr:CbiX/SirB N-terminal domain-containing protein [Polaromonas sp.]NDP62322.1 cobalamin biosynthesis protein CbiX [Polaromonas sp.]